MNAIIIKINDKVIGVSKINDITIKKFLDLEKEVAENWQKKDEKILNLKNEIAFLKAYTSELNAKINYLGRQIAIDRGEINEDSEKEYVITIEKIKHEELEEDNATEIQTEVIISEPEVSQEEDAYFEEKEESEVTE